MVNEMEKPSDDRLIKVREVLVISGLSRSALYQKIKEGAFHPKSSYLLDRQLGYIVRS